MAKVMECLRSGGIVEDDSNLKETSEGNTLVALANDEGKKSEDTPAQPLTQKNGNATRAAKTKSSRKASTMARLKATKKSSTSKEVDAAVKRAVASKLAELEDKFLKQTEAARSLHPRHQEGKVPSNYVL